MSESFGIVVEVKGAPQAVQAVDGVERALADVTAIAQKFGNEAVRAMREASAGAKQQKAAQDSLARAYREIVGPAADYNRKLQEAIALERQGAISAKQRADYVRGLQREMRQFSAQQQGGFIGGIKGAASSQLAGVLGPAAVVATTVSAARAVIDLSDSYTTLTNRLRAVTHSEAEALAVRGELLRISNANRVATEATATVYQRMASAGDTLGKSQREILQFTDSLTKAVKISGATAAEAQAGMIQLAQGLGAGALRGDELRSVLEQLPTVADVIAKQLGVTRGQLRQLGEQGKITADVVFDAFASARTELDQRFSKSVVTVSDLMQVLHNQVEAAVGGLVEQSEIVPAISAAFAELGPYIEESARNLGTMVKGMVELAKVSGKTLDVLSKFSTLDAIFGNGTTGEVIKYGLTPGAGIAAIDGKINGDKSLVAAVRAGFAAAEERAAARKRTADLLRDQYLASKEGDDFVRNLRRGYAELVDIKDKFTALADGKDASGDRLASQMRASADEAKKLRETAGREFFASIVDGFDEMGAAAGRFADQMPDVSGEVAIARDAMRQMAEVEAATLAERLDRQRQVFDEVYGAGIRYQQMIEAARAELDRGALSIDQFNAYAEKLRIDTFGGATLLEQMAEEARVATEDVKMLSDALAGQLGNALSESIGAFAAWASGAEVSVKDMVRSMLIDLAILMAKLLAFQALKATIGVGDGTFGGIVAGALGFAGSRAGGGTYVAPNGGGGTDSVPLFARVSPGERVTFTPPGQQPANAAPPSPVMIQPVIVHDQAAAVRAALSAPEGVQVVVSAVSSNPAAFRAALGLR